MPPPLPQSSLSSLARQKSCLSLPLCHRSFSTSSARSKIGPESPKFIEIPRLVQPTATPYRDIKGTLPPPRNIFPRRAGDKTTTEYLAHVTPEPTAQHQLSWPQNDYIAWRRRMAATRRQNLREGLIELHSRKVKNERIVAYRSSKKAEDRHLRITAPLREDERLTAITVRATTRALQRGNVPDPNREERIAASKARVEMKAKMLEQERRDALHTLYMHAREFITTEEQLNAEIEEVFVDVPFRDYVNAGKDNMWDAYGPPPTVQQLLSEVTHTQKSAIDYHGGPAVPYGKRILKIAEELTGGKMEEKM